MAESQSPIVEAVVTFLTPSDGGRSQPAWNSPLYRPHIVIGDPQQRVALTDESGKGTEEYLGVQFAGEERVLRQGVDESVRLALVYHPQVDYRAVQPGAEFTIREGGTVVGYGQITARPAS